MRRLKSLLLFLSENSPKMMKYKRFRRGLICTSTVMYTLQGAKKSKGKRSKEATTMKKERKIYAKALTALEPGKLVWRAI